jgi:hypothetical protein
MANGLPQTKAVSDYLRLPSEEAELGSRKSIPKDALIRLLTGARAGYEDVYSQMGYEDPVAAFDALIELINSGEILSYIAQWNDPAVQNPPTLKGSPFDVKGRYKEAGETDYFVDIEEQFDKTKNSNTIRQALGAVDLDLDHDDIWALGPVKINDIIQTGEEGSWREVYGSNYPIQGDTRESIGVPWFPAKALPRPGGKIGGVGRSTTFSYPPLSDLSNDEWIDMWREQSAISSKAVADMNPDSVFIRGETGLLPFIDPERWVKIDETEEEYIDRVWRNLETLMHEFRHVDPTTGEAIAHGSEIDIEGADDILIKALRETVVDGLRTHPGTEGLDFHKLYKDLGFR